MTFPVGIVALVTALVGCGSGSESETDERVVRDGLGGAGGAGGTGNGEGGTAGASGAGPKPVECPSLPPQVRILTNQGDVFDGYTPLAVTKDAIIYNSNPASPLVRQVYALPIVGGSAKLLSEHASPHKGAILPSAIGDAVACSVLESTLFGETIAERMIFADTPNDAALILGSPLFSDLLGVPAAQLTYGPSSLGRIEFPNRYRMAVSVSDSKKSVAEGGKDIAIIGFKINEPKIGDYIDVEGVTKISVASGHIYNPTLSPNGRFLAYWRTSDPQETIDNNQFPNKAGSFELVLRDMNDGAEKVIQPFIQPERLEKGMRYIQRISVSNNGDIAYGVQLPTKEDILKTHVLIYHADSGKIEDIGHGETPSMSGDGALLVYEKTAMGPTGQEWQEAKFGLAFRGVKTGLERFLVMPVVGAGRCDVIPALDAQGRNVAWYSSSSTPGGYEVAGMNLHEFLPDTDDDGLFDISDPCPTNPAPNCQ